MHAFAHRWLSLFAAFAVACPDPTAGIQTVGGEGAPSPTGTGEPGVDAAAKAQGATQPDAARFQVNPGEGVLLSGTFDYPGTKTGNFRLDFLKQEENAPPRLVHTLELKGPGAWKVTAPKDFGPIYIVGFIDQKADGPSTDDPGGRTKEPVVIAGDPIADISIAVGDHADLGELTPGGADGPPPPPPEMPQGTATGPQPTPPEGSPEGGAPPGGAPPAAPE